MVRKNGLVEHEERYWHVPKLCLWPLVGLLAFGFLAVANFGLLDWSWLDVEMARGFVFSDLVLVYPFFGEWLFVAGFFVSLAALVKGGYGKLKPFSEEGLVVGLVLGLVWGLVVGLVVGLFAGLVLGLVLGLIGEFD